MWRLIFVLFLLCAVPAYAQAPSPGAIPKPGSLAILTKPNNFQAGVGCAQYPITLSGTAFTPNLYSSCQFSVTLNSSSDTIANPTYPVIGWQYTIAVTQPGSGGPFTVAWGSGYSWVSGSAPTLNTGANAVTLITCQVITLTPTMQCYGPLNGASTEKTVATPGATNLSTSVYVMLGTGATITPATTGTVEVIISQECINGTSTGATDGLLYQIAWGTGSAPANGAAQTGTVVGIPHEMENGSTVTTGDRKTGCPINALITGLTPGTTYWIDEQIKAVVAADAQTTINVVEDLLELR